MIKFGPYIDRKYAKSIGSKYYMNGKLCHNGHMDRKLVSSNKCQSCLVRTDARRAYEAAWKQKKRKDPDFVALENERRAIWLSKDGVLDALYEKNREYQKNLYETNEGYRDYKADYSKKWKKDNPEKARESSNNWRRKNPDKVRLNNQKRRVHRSITLGKSLDVDISALFRESLGFCKYCSANLFSGYHLDHIMPICLGGGNSQDNLQCICASCNLRKGGKHPDVWHEEIGWQVTEQMKD